MEAVTLPDMTRIDCDTCVVRGPACHDCVVTVLLGPPPELAFDEEERRALSVLADSGLVPPLRLVRAVPAPPDRGAVTCDHGEPEPALWDAGSDPHADTA